MHSMHYHHAAISVSHFHLMQEGETSLRFNTSSALQLTESFRVFSLLFQQRIILSKEIEVVIAMHRPIGIGEGHGRPDQ